MADQPQSSNSNRISALLNDLAAQRAQQHTPALPPTPPTNLPTPTPVRGTAPVPRPTAPPPMPREMLVPRAPQPPRPPVVPVPPRPPAPPVPSLVQPPKPQEQPYTSELRTMSADIGKITTGQAPVGIKPPAPAAPAFKSPVPAAPVTPGIAIPASTGSSGVGRKVAYGVTGLLLIGALFWLISLFTGGGTTQSSPSPSASPSATLPVTGKQLSSYFRQTDGNVELTADGTAKAEFSNALGTAQPGAQQALRITVSGPFSGSLGDFLDATAGPVPSDVKTGFSPDWTAMAYGQKEQFDASGQLVLGASPRTRLVVLGELKDISQENQAMGLWEKAGLAGQLQSLFGIDTSKAIVNGFSSGTYRQIPVRFWNFPYADSSLDWAIVTASNNKNYLVISASRESLFFVIDQLMQ